jgi:hypothetical protein
MGIYNTSCIITDQQISLVKAIDIVKIKNNLKFTHIFDNWHYIQTLKHQIIGI